MDDIVRVASYDGQTVWLENRVPLYEVGNFLGGGAAGTVYEAENTRSKEHFALKILNPLGYKMLSPSLLRRCAVMSKGKPVTEAAERAKEKITIENVWWLLNGSTKQFLVAYYSERQRSLHELSLVQCMNIWGVELPQEESPCSLESPHASPSRGITSPSRSSIPALPPKYEDFVRRRARIFREICNMRKISPHENVIRLESVLELAQDSKCTIFLVMELANGGELFDRIKIDCGTVEETAGKFFSQLLHGVRHCHDEGVCHRDLKPENLLLQDSAVGGPLLKIADFGFSARLAMADGGDLTNSTVPSTNATASSIPLYSSGSNTTPPSVTSSTSPMRVLLSVVGSPFYVAPEVLKAQGYDGRKADSWSLGVILYAMLAGNMPFAQDLTTCKRFRQFCIWAREQGSISSKFWQDPALVCPPWLFSVKFSTLVRGLIVAMLLPDPADRISVREAQRHSWCRSHEYQSVSRGSGSGSDSGEIGIVDSNRRAGPSEEVRSDNQVAVEEQESQQQLPIHPASSFLPDNSESEGSLQQVQVQEQEHDVQQELQVEPSDSVQLTSKPPKCDDQPQLPHLPPSVVTSPAKEKQSSSLTSTPSPRSSQLARHLSNAAACSPPVLNSLSLAELAAQKEQALRELNPAPPSSAPSSKLAGNAGDNLEKVKPKSPTVSPSSHIQTVLHSLECHGISSLELMDVESDYGDNVDMLSEHEDDSSEQFQMDGDDDGDCDSESALKKSKKSPGTSMRRFDLSSFNDDNYGAMQQEKGTSGSLFQGMTDGPPPSIGGVVRTRRSSSTGSDIIFDPFQHEHNVSNSLVDSHGSEECPPFRIPRSPYDGGNRRSPYENNSGSGVYGSQNSTGSIASSPRRSNGGLTTPPPIPTDAIPYIIAGTPDLLGPEESLLFPLSSDCTSQLEQPVCHHNNSSTTKEDVVASPPHSSYTGRSGSSGSSNGTSICSPLGNKHPPSFHDVVKRSTRFITSVPAGEVLETVESILEQCRMHKTASPIGVIGRVELYWESYRLDVWGADASDTSPPLCSLHLYQLPTTPRSAPDSPVRLHATGSLGGFPGGSNAPLFLVEFVRGQLEIFAFKRFYEWIRQRVSELVKRDYAFNLFDQSGSPILSPHMASSPLRGGLGLALNRS